MSNGHCPYYELHTYQLDTYQVYSTMASLDQSFLLDSFRIKFEQLSRALRIEIQRFEPSLTRQVVKGLRNLLEVAFDVQLVA